MREADERGQRRVDDVGGNAGEELRVAALIFEAVAEMRADEQAAQLRDDAAADIETAERTERQHEISGERAEQRAEHADRFHADAA